MSNRLSDAEAALQRGALEACLARLEPELPSFMDNASAARALTLCGVAHLRLGNLGRAAAYLQTSLDKHETGTTLVQLAHVERYLKRHPQARERLQRAEELARHERDGALMSALLVARGELELAQQRPREAVLAFGQALGLSELSPDPHLSVLPLAGLAHAQAAWGYPKKGRALAQRALARARSLNDRLGEVRARFALGVATRTAAEVEAAETLALELPHRPLAALIREARAALEAEAG